jgi:AcrR family transcriptional regulator
MNDVIVSAPRTAGRPRSTRAHEAIIDAVLDLIAEGTPMAEISIEAIAAKAGVGKATIYRRWAGKNELLLEAVKTLKAPQPLPIGGSVRDDLIRTMSVVNVNIDPRAAKIFPCLMPEVMRNSDLQGLYQQIIEPRREVTRGILRRGIANGELRPDIDIELTTLLLTGPVVLQRWLGWNPKVDEATLPERVVDAVLAGIAAR